MINLLLLACLQDVDLNLARTANARVYASSVNGSRPMSNGHYGVRNLFDGGQNVINNINYSYWLTDAADEHWVRVRFDKPVTLHRAVIHALGQEKPSAARLRVTAGGKAIEVPYVQFKGPRTVCEPDKPLEGVNEVIIDLVSDQSRMIRVDEIELIGPGAKVEPVRPAVDVDEREAGLQAQEAMRAYFARRYAAGAAEKTADGWSYTIRGEGKELLKVILNKEGVPIRIEHIEADHVEKLSDK